MYLMKVQTWNVFNKNKLRKKDNDLILSSGLTIIYKVSLISKYKYEYIHIHVRVSIVYNKYKYNNK